MDHLAGKGFSLVSHAAGTYLRLLHIVFSSQECLTLPDSDPNKSRDINLIRLLSAETGTSLNQLFKVGRLRLFHDKEAGYMNAN